MLKNAANRIDLFFYKRGAHAPELLFLLRAQIFITAASLLLGLALLWRGSWLLFFALGSALALFNFWGLANFSIKLLGSGARFNGIIALRQFFSFVFRFLLTAAILLFFKNSIIPLVAGLSSFMLVVTIWGLTRLPQFKA